jgi:hypothetical protein
LPSRASSRNVIAACCVVCQRRLFSEGSCSGLGKSIRLNELRSSKTASSTLPPVMTMVTHHCRTAVPQWLVSGIFGGRRQARGFLAPFGTKTASSTLPPVMTMVTHHCRTVFRNGWSPAFSAATGKRAASSRRSTQRRSMRRDDRAAPR